MILGSDEVHFVPDRLARPAYHRGISPPTAACIVREFQRCPSCKESLDPDVRNAKYVDRDVEWDGDLNPRKDFLTCEECDNQFRVLVEEKAFGVIGESQLPEWAEGSDDVFFVRCDDTETYCVINTHQISIHER